MCNVQIYDFFIFLNVVWSFDSIKFTCSTESWIHFGFFALRNPSSADMFANKISNNLVRVNGKGALIKKVSLEDHVYVVDGLRIHNLCRYCLKTSTTDCRCLSGMWPVEIYMYDWSELIIHILPRDKISIRLSAISLLYLKHLSSTERDV